MPINGEPFEKVTIDGIEIPLPATFEAELVGYVNEWGVQTQDQYTARRWRLWFDRLRILGSIVEESYLSQTIPMPG